MATVGAPPEGTRFPGVGPRHPQHQVDIGETVQPDPLAAMPPQVQTELSGHGHAPLGNREAAVQQAHGENVQVEPAPLGLLTHQVLGQR